MRVKKMGVKKVVLGLPVAAMALSSVVYADGPTVYGRIDTSFGLVDNEATDEAWETNPNASRLGFQGNSALDHNLEAVYQVEFELDSDDGATAVKTRNIYAGIKGGFGTVGLGRIDSPFKLSQGGFDQFDNRFGDIGKIMLGEDRLNNQVFFQSNTYGGFSGRIAIVPGESHGDESNDGPADTISANVGYQMADLYLGLGLENGEHPSFVSVNYDAIRLVATYKIADLALGALYQTIDADDANYDEDGFGVSAAYSIGRHTLRFQYLDSEQQHELAAATKPAGSASDSIAALGLDCKLGKQTTTYVEYTSLDGKADADQTASLVVGILHKF